MSEMMHYTGKLRTISRINEKFLGVQNTFFKKDSGRRSRHAAGPAWPSAQIAMATKNLVKSFSGVQGAVLQKSPLVAEGNEEEKNGNNYTA